VRCHMAASAGERHPPFSPTPTSFPQGAIAFDDDGLAAAWQSLASAVSAHLPVAGVHGEANVIDGRLVKVPVVSALQAFYPGLEVLAGRVDEARSHLIPLQSMWMKHKALPELLDVATVPPAPIGFGRDAPLRPEVIESLWYLHAATGDRGAVAAVAEHVGALLNLSHVPCGCE